MNDTALKTKNEDAQTNPTGGFCWYELLTSDDRAAEAFYRHAIGWDAQDAGMPGMRYTLLKVGDTAVAGMMTMPAEACVDGAKPGWLAHVAVADVDAKAAQVTKLGGKVLKEPTDIPGIGRFACVADPQGAVFFLFRGNGPMPPQPAPGTPGTFGWHELYSDDWKAAFAFYEKLFGWSKRDAMDMGPMGTYQLFATNDATECGAIGGMMNAMPGGPRNMWNYYINVDATDAAVSRITDKGGKVINGPMQVPGGSWIAQCVDPQGVMFSIVGAKR
jgi:predicted enzyme related to lactoylglutathione lyase